MSRDGEWASHIELVALADAVGVPILVTTDCEDEEFFQVWIYPKEQQTDQVLLLGYSFNHYYSLEGNFMDKKIAHACIHDNHNVASVPEMKGSVTWCTKTSLRRKGGRIQEENSR